MGFCSQAIGKDGKWFYTGKCGELREEIAALKAEVERLNRLIDEMLGCANNMCRCGHGGVCPQCRDAVERHREAKEAE
jgi:hypothetical protein